MKIKKYMRLYYVHFKKLMTIRFRPAGVIKGCLFLVLSSSIIFLIAFHKLNHNGALYNLLFAITTGVAASAVVTIIAEAQHNRIRNLQRIHSLDKYFNTVTGYARHVDMFTSVLEQKRSHESAWTASIEELSETHPYVKLYNAERLFVISGQIVDIQSMCQECLEHIELMSVKELEIIEKIRLALESIEMMLEQDLMEDEADHNFSTEFIKELHETFDGHENDPAIKIRLQKVFDHFGVSSLDKLCDQIKTMDDRAKVQVIVDKEFEGYEFPDQTEDVKNDDFSESKQEDSNLVYETPEIKYFKRNQETKENYSERISRNVKKYMPEFLKFPSSMHDQTRKWAVIKLIEIDQAMRKLIKIVEKEPLYGEVIEHGRAGKNGN